MQHQKKIYTAIFSSSLFFLSACTPDKVPEAKGGYYSHGIYFGTDLSHYFKEGIDDGCETARGNYRKSHTLFQNSEAYQDGWFLGRNRCRSLLKIDKNGNLIL